MSQEQDVEFDDIGDEDHKEVNQFGKLTEIEALNAYDKLARKFIDKCESGGDRSVLTYSEFKRILERRYK